MTDNDRYRRAVHALWARGLAGYEAWPAEQRQAVHPAVEALLAWLRECPDPDALIHDYWEDDDAPGALLRRHLPPGWATGMDPDDLLLLEEACFQLRLRELWPASDGVAPDEAADEARCGDA